MKDIKTIASTILDLTGHLKINSKEEEKSLQFLEEHLARMLVAEQEELPLTANGFHSERSDFLNGIALENTSRFRDLESLTNKVVRKYEKRAKSDYRVFRRTVPKANGFLTGSSPTWGTGVAVDFTLGPYTSNNGLRYWFDFYRIPKTKLVAIHFGNEAEPSILLPLRLPRIVSPRINYQVARGSIWIRSNLLAPGAPAGKYTGLTVKGGNLVLSSPNAPIRRKLTMPPSSFIELNLQLAQQDTPTSSNDDHGLDAKNSEIELPGHCSFKINQTKAKLTKLDSATWQLYGDERIFSLSQTPTIEYSELLGRVLVTVSSNRKSFDITKEGCLSHFSSFVGSAAVLRNVWALPSGSIDVSRPPDAAGIGALALKCDLGISAKWEGLEGGRVTLGASWFMLEPGLISVVAESANGLYARQKYNLWQNDNNQIYSEALLQFNKSFPFRFVASHEGFEVIVTLVDSALKVDRPVKVNGQPFEVKGRDTFYTLFDSEAFKGILLYDEDILYDKLKEGTGVKLEDDLYLKPASIALNNALLTVTTPFSFFLSGELKEKNRIATGTFFLLHGLFYLIPTLPDPYAANLLPLLSLKKETGFNKMTAKGIYRNIIALLLCKLDWQVDNQDPTSDQVDVSYQFLPFGLTKTVFTKLDPAEKATPTGEAAVEEGRAEGEGTATDAVARGATIRSGVSITEGQTLAAADFLINQDLQAWSNFTSLFGRPVFSLLDVSTNADLMGIAYGIQNEEVIMKLTHTAKGKSSAPKLPGVPFEIEGMDLKSSGKFVKAFTLPQISWEPVINLSDLQDNTYDPPKGFLGFQSDGGPTQIFNDSPKTVTLAPIPVTSFILDEFQNEDNLNTFSIFTLPFGLQSVARFDRENPFDLGEPGSNLRPNQPAFPDEISGAFQVKATGAFNPEQNNYNFQGSTFQLTNVISSESRFTTILGQRVTEIFNREFGPTSDLGLFKSRGVPLERIDFSGYGASIFSHWLNDKAKFAQTSQAKFDVWKGRTAHEIIQVRSMIYPWGIRVVRTITLFRISTAYVYRLDSGWRAESDGLFDFNYSAYPSASADEDETISQQPYIFHPGVVKGVYHVRNIRDTEDYEDFIEDVPIQGGEAILDEKDRAILATEDEIGTNRNIKLSPVYFNAEVAIDFVKEGSVNGRVPSKKMLGFIQISPRGVPIHAFSLTALLNQYPDIGGDVNCLLDIGNSGQKMRINRVEIRPSMESHGLPIFAGVVKGSPILPSDGSWSIVQQNIQTNEVISVADTNGIPLIREGAWVKGADGVWSADQTQLNKALRIADPTELFVELNIKRHFGFLQNTGTQKVLFRLPSFHLDSPRLFSGNPGPLSSDPAAFPTSTSFPNNDLRPYIADAYHLLNSKGIFPNLDDIEARLDFDDNDIAVKINEAGYKLIEKGTEDVKKILEQALPPGPWYWVGTEGGDEPVKIYLEYSTPGADSLLKFDLDSQINDWLSVINDTSIVVDLGPLDRAFVIKGNFNAKKGVSPSIESPVMEFVHKDLQKVKDVLQVLEYIATTDPTDPKFYQDLLVKSLQVAFSNNPETWEYKFHATKEIPVLRFPPPLADSPNAPLRLEASLLAGCYFNESLKITTDFKQLIPSAGAFVEFYAQLSVMCVSISLATVYAVGQAKLRMYADLKKGPGLAMRFGFGVELAVGLPVIGSVSVMYLVGIDMDFNEDLIRVEAFLMFRGRAELVGGLVSVTIMIEAKGGIERLPGEDQTNVLAQVTFGLDISVFMVIDISFEESWQERRQIA